MSDRDGFDYDWLVIGSGFGGATSALRLAEKGYRVAVLECGRRFRDEDFAKTTWEMSRYYWMPKLGLKGILRLTLFKDLFVAPGAASAAGRSDTPTRCTARAQRSTPTRRSPAWRTGAANWGRTTTRPSGCSA